MRIVDLQLHRVPLCTRLPFRYSIATMTKVGHDFVALTLDYYVGACHRGFFGFISASYVPAPVSGNWRSSNLFYKIFHSFGRVVNPVSIDI